MQFAEFFCMLPVNKFLKSSDKQIGHENNLCFVFRVSDSLNLAVYAVDISDAGKAASFDPSQLLRDGELLLESLWSLLLLLHKGV